MKKILVLIAIVHLTIASFCQSDPVLSLAQVYKDYFKIGVAVSPRALKTDEAELIRTQFNSMTAENAMKMGPIHPRDTSVSYTHLDVYKRQFILYAPLHRWAITEPMDPSPKIPNVLP